MTLQGCVDEISRSRVFGWAMNTEEPHSAVEIIVYVDGQEAASGVANLVRPGLKEHLGGEATGAYQFDISLDPPLSVFREHMVEVVQKGSQEQLSGWRRKLSAPRPTTSRFTPIVVTSPDRSGSTVLIKELMQHPQVVAADRHPYEIKLVAYYAAAYRALAGEEDRVNSTDPDSMLDPDHRFWIGHNPYNNQNLFSIDGNGKNIEQLFENAIPERYAEMFQRNIEDYYSAIKSDSGKIGAAFFAEKGAIEEPAREGVRLLFGTVREIVLLRDPRDILYSAMAFWKQSSAQAIEIMTTALPRMEQIRKSAGGDTLFVRYEDLITNPAETRLTISQFIGLQNLIAPADAVGADIAAASIERWKEELTESEVRTCEELFWPYMETFGYSRDTAHKDVTRIDSFAGMVAVERARVSVIDVDGSSLTPMLEVTFRPDGQSAPYLASGWYPIESEFVWTSGHKSALQFDRPAQPGRFRLRLVGRPLIIGDLLTRQRLVLSVGGERLGETKLNSFSVIEADLPWDLIAAHERVTIELECPDAARPRDLDPAKSEDRVLGFALERMIVFGTSEIDEIAVDAALPANMPPEPASAESAPGEISPEELMLQFESIGENCEFGLVQRRCGADPLGLFRFSSTPLPLLLKALKNGFEGMGEPGSIEAQVSSGGTEYMVLDKRFGFLYHAWVLVGEGTAEEVEARELRRLPLLIRKFTDEVMLGEKIFVYHGMDPLHLDQARELSTALRQYGPTTLLWVELADEGHAPGMVEFLETGLLKGYMDRFAPGENAHDLSLDCWVTLCRNAYRLWHAP